MIDFMKKYGSIQRTVLIDDTSSDFHENLIVEFSSGSAVEGLESLLPYRYTSKGDPNVVYDIQTLSSVYTSRLGGSVKNYLTELKELAKLSGKDYAAILGEMMMQISSDVRSMQPAIEQSSSAQSETCYESRRHNGSLSAPSQNDSMASGTSLPITDERRVLPLPESDVNPPDVQKVVVEHIVKREDMGLFSSSYSVLSLGKFLGRVMRL